MRRRYWTWAAACVAVLAVAGCGNEAVAPVAIAHLPNAVHTRAAAEQVANVVLDRVKLPPSLEGNRTVPSPALGNPPQRPATSDLAQATYFFTAQGTMARTIAFFERHRPAGYTASGSGQGSSDTDTGKGLGENCLAGVNHSGVVHSGRTV
jgi:hypothetical protein